MAVRYFKYHTVITFSKDMGEKNMGVSVVIPNYNGEKYLDEQLKSIFLQEM